jgi:chromosome segregation ATPase
MEEAKMIKKKLKTIQAERDHYKDEVKATQKELETIKAQILTDKENQCPAFDENEVKKTNEILEKKLRKYIAHCEHLENECKLMKEENDEITPLREELEKATLELERVNIEFEKAEVTNADFSKSMVKNNELGKLLTEKEEIHEKLKAEYTLIKQKYAKQQEINESLKRCSEDLEYEKNRQISYLENENLQYLGELKETKKEINSLRAQRNVMCSDASQDLTEDLGSIISMKLSENNKENQPVQSSPAKVSKHTNVNTRSHTEVRKGLGAGEGNNDDDPGECKTS